MYAHGQAMNEVRRARIHCEIDLLTSVRDRIARIRDDEDKSLSGDPKYGSGDSEASDTLSEVNHILLLVIGKLDRIKKQPNVLETHR